MKILIIDGNSIFHRAYHSMPPFKTHDGELVNAVYGFISMLFSLLIKNKPDYVAVAFDLDKKTFRHLEYCEYKATRAKAPDDLYIQIPRVKEFLKIFNIPIYEKEGFEADDMLGTLSTLAGKNKDIHTYIVTSDRDALQLVNESVTVMAPVKGISEVLKFDPKLVKEKYGVVPAQIPDLKGLMGDSSDNIKGVKGIGPKTAVSLIEKYQSVEGIYEHIDEISGSSLNKLKEGKESAFTSKRLATLVLDIPVEVDFYKNQIGSFDGEKVEEFFERLNFKSLAKKFKDLKKVYDIPEILDKRQEALF